MPEIKNLLLIFTRNPEAGKVKKRLAATIGNEAALDIYKTLVEHTATITKGLAVDREVQYSEKIEEKDVWDSNLYNKSIQEGKDLGERMKNAFKKGFKSGYTQIIIIGSDLLDLHLKDLEKAFDALSTSEYVIGPAEDGGYYLLGMRSFHPAIFENKKWSTNTVFQDTLKDLTNNKITILETRNDIDYAEDLKGHQEFRKYLKRR